jgi:hypothetical protein
MCLSQSGGLLSLTASRVVDSDVRVDDAESYAGAKWKIMTGAERYVLVGMMGCLGHTTTTDAMLSTSFRLVRS